MSLANISYGGNGNGAQMTASRELQVTSKLGALGASLELLEKDLAEFEERLRMVCTESMPTPTSDTPPNKLTMPLCQLAEHLQSFITRTEYIRARIASLSNRLEV